MQPTLLGVAGAGRLLRLRRTRRGQELGQRREDFITPKKLRMTNAGSSEHDFPAGAVVHSGSPSRGDTLSLPAPEISGVGSIAAHTSRAATILPQQRVGWSR